MPRYWFWDEDYWAEFERRMREMQKLMAREFGRLPELLSPSADIAERDGQLVIKLDMPGVSKSDIDLIATEDYIEVKAERAEVKEEKRAKFYRKERAYRSYFRRLPLPAKIAPEKVRAEYKDGVLTVIAPFKEKVKELKKTKVKVK